MSTTNSSTRLQDLSFDDQNSNKKLIQQAIKEAEVLQEPSGFKPSMQMVGPPPPPPPSEVMTSVAPKLSQQQTMSQSFPSNVGAVSNLLNNNSPKGAIMIFAICAAFQLPASRQLLTNLVAKITNKPLMVSIALSVLNTILILVVLESTK